MGGIDKSDSKAIGFGVAAWFAAVVFSRFYGTPLVHPHLHLHLHSTSHSYPPHAHNL